MTPKAKPKKTRRAAKPARASSGGAARGGQPAYLEELRALIELVGESGISDLEVQSDGRVFRIGRNGQPFVAAAPAGLLPAAPPAAAAPAGPQARPETHVAIKSPIVGTFYRAPAPDAEPYVEEGDRVSIGQTVCIVEAMKLMNEIQSEVAGRIVRICVPNAQPVEYGQEVFWVDPGA